MILLRGNNLKFHTLFKKVRFYSSNPLLDSLINDCNSTQMSDSIKRRKISLDLSHYIDLSYRYQQLNQDKTKIDDSRTKITETLKKIHNEHENKEIHGLNSTAKLLRNDSKHLKHLIQDLEKLLTPLVYKLPNYIDEKTLDENVDIFVSPFDERKSECHIKLGQLLNVLEFHSPTKYFYKNKGALFELSVLSYFTKYLSKNSFKLTSNPDFCRDTIMEISGHNLFSLGKYTDNDSLYLHGGASCTPFLSLFYKTVIDNNHLPLRLVTQGRSYHPPKMKDEGLYYVPFSSAVQMFILCGDNSVENEFDNAINVLIPVFQNLKIPFKIVYSSASSLELPECLRADIQVYSAYQKQFKSVGHISVYKDYFSKRSQMFYSKNGGNSFVHVIAGPVIKIPPLLAAYLEFNLNCDLPQDVENFNF